MASDVVPKYGVFDDILNFVELLPSQHERLPSPRNPHLLSRDLCHRVSKEPLVVQIDASKRGHNNGTVRYRVGRVQPPAHPHFHDHNIQLQRLKYRHRSAGQNFEFRGLGSQLLVQFLDFTPDSIVHVSGDGLAIYDDRVSNGQEVWTVESADGKWGRRGLEDGGEESGDAAFTVGPRDVACWPSVCREV